MGCTAKPVKINFLYGIVDAEPNALHQQYPHNAHHRRIRALTSEPIKCVIIRTRKQRNASGMVQIWEW